MHLIFSHCIEGRLSFEHVFIQSITISTHNYCGSHCHFTFKVFSPHSLKFPQKASCTVFICVHFSARSHSLRMSADQIEAILSGRSPRHHDVTSPRKQRRKEQEREALLRWMEERKAQKMREFRKEQRELKEREVNPYKPQEDNKNMVRIKTCL